MSAESLVRADFRIILKKAEALNKLTASTGYYTAQDELNQLLRTFIRLADLSVLNGKQVLQLCDLVQKHRPVALHSFLITCGQHIK